MRGRKPKPTHLKLLSLSHNVRTDGGEPIPAGDLCMPPAELGERERVIWHRIIERAPVGLLRELDSDVMQLYCETWVDREFMRAKIRSGDSEKQTHRDYHTANTLLRQLASDLGFNPTARGRISIVGHTKSTNKFTSNAETAAQNSA
ncbi:MAG: P27 family phage terminase small subunit [Betaproteobacteria bacterium]